VNLAEIQKEFWKYLSSYNKLPNLIKNSVENSKDFTIDERLAVYGNAYLWRLQEAIAMDFPILGHFMGHDQLMNAIKDYLEVNPSEYFSISRASAKFPYFLKTHPIIGSYVWADELAQFEWAKVSLFENLDHGILTKSELIKIPTEKWPTLKFKLIPNLTIMHTTYRIEELSEESELDIKLTPTPQSLKVWRKQEEVYFSTTSHEEEDLLMAIRAGNNFNEICSQFGIKYSETQAAQMVFNIITDWLDDEIIESITY